MWIKCSSLLPKEGMLIMCREPVSESKIVYYGGEVVSDKDGKALISVWDDQDIYFTDHSDPMLMGVEWKEIEKE